MARTQHKDRKKRDQNKFERFCEELTESGEASITKAIKDELAFQQFVDAVCYGDASQSCGTARAKCAPGRI